MGSVSGPTTWSSVVCAPDGSSTRGGGAVRGAGGVRPRWSGRRIVGCRSPFPVPLEDPPACVAGRVFARVEGGRLKTPGPTAAWSCRLSLGHRGMAEVELHAEDVD